MKDPTEIILALIGIIIIGLFVNFLIAFPVMWIWNSVVVGIIEGCPTITYWKAWCLLMLCSFLFKSSGISFNKT